LVRQRTMYTPERPVESPYSNLPGLNPDRVKVPYTARSVNTIDPDIRVIFTLTV